jgi:hypothetical protein
MSGCGTIVAEAKAAFILQNLMKRYIDSIDGAR